MTQPQEDTLRVISDPINLQCKLTSLDQAAIRTAMEERAELLAVAGEALGVSTISSPSAMASALVRLRPRLADVVDRANGGQP